VEDRHRLLASRVPTDTDGVRADALDGDGVER
jgi:hypothetical protein